MSSIHKVIFTIGFIVWTWIGVIFLCDHYYLSHRHTFMRGSDKAHWECLDCRTEFTGENALERCRAK